MCHQIRMRPTKENGVLFFTSDNANDEASAMSFLQVELKNLVFEVNDTTHSLQLAIRNAVAGDPEVDIVQKVLLTNKRPVPSVSNLLRHSPRFRSVFSKQQQEDSLAVLQHLGWAPQRMTSRSRPYARVCMRVKSLLAALAHEATHGPEKDTAMAVLREIAPYKRIMLAGLMADLTFEHHKAVRETDTSDPCPIQAVGVIQRFKSRCNVLFGEGLIMTMKESFTGQILQFLDAPQVLFGGW